MNFQQAIDDLWRDLHNVQFVWQVIALALGLGIAWYVSRQLRTAHHDLSQRAQGGLRRVRFPLLALALILPARAVLHHYASTSLLDLATPLLITLVTSRIFVYLLQFAFPAGSFLVTSERWIAWLVWLGGAFYITGLAPDILAFLDDIKLPLGAQEVSLLTILRGLLSVCIALLISLWLGHLLEDRVMNAQQMNANLRVMLTKIFRPLLVLIALLIALPAVGINLTALSVFGGALGVGLGFGLQKTASNYISGFIILIDRSIAIGNLVTIESHTGLITHMTARYVVLRKLDGTDVIIPNDTIIGSTVINHAYSDKRVVVTLDVQVAYNTDLDHVLQLLTNIAKEQARVLTDPPPGAKVTSFGDNGINLQLAFWINDPEYGNGSLISDIYMAIWKTFREQGIEIPYPQREVRLIGGTPKTPA